MTHKMIYLGGWAVLLGTLAACGTEPRIPSAVTLSATSLTFSALGEEQQLSSSVTDEAGNPLNDASVSWSTSNAAVATVTDAGLVTSRGPGSAEIRAGAGSASATAQVTVSQTPAAIEKISGDSQAVSAGEGLPAPLVVQVNDSRGNAIAGVTVTFTVSQGEGSVNSISATTGADGRASTAFITGTDSGSPQEVSAIVQATTVSVSFTAIVPSDGAGFNIGIRFLTAATPSQRQAFTEARLRWEAAITQDLQDDVLNILAGDCTPDTPAVNQVIDDVLIMVSLVPIDGPNGVVGGAGPCYVRDYGPPTIDPGDLPILGVMQFDTDDLEMLEADGYLSNVIRHEMGHVLGFGTIWDLSGFLAEPSLPEDPDLPPIPGADPHFTGAQAIAAFDDVGGTAYVTGAKVPVEDTGGPGTADVHWRESVLDTELMTGFIAAGQSPLSIVTLASLADQGYAVDLNSADSYSLLMPMVRAFAPKRVLKLGNDVLRVPIKRVDSRGRVTGVVRR
jgi:hypothetical protein